MGYENPDMPGVIEGLKKFHAVAVNHEYDFIPSLQERLGQAARYFSQSVRAVADKASNLEVMVESAGLDELLQQWIIVQGHTRLAAGIQASAINTLSDTFFQRVSRIASAARAAKEQIEMRAVEGEGLNLEHYSDPLLIYDAARLEELEQQAVDLQAEEDRLRADKQVIDAAVTLLQSRTWLDHVRDLLPTPEQIQGLVSTALVGRADADTVIAALERLTQYLGVYDGGFRLFSLTEARNKISDRLVDLRTLSNKNKTDARVLQERAQKIRRHAELVEVRACWVANIRLVAKGMGVFIARVRATTEVDEHLLRQTSAELAGFLGFLRRISR